MNLVLLLLLGRLGFRTVKKISAILLKGLTFEDVFSCFQGENIYETIKLINMKGRTLSTFLQSALFEVKIG